MIYLTSKKLEEQLGSVSLEKQTIQYQNKIYRKKRLLIKKKIELLEKLCQEYSEQNIQTLVIEHKNLILLWVEDKEMDKNDSVFFKDSTSGLCVEPKFREDLNNTEITTPSTQKVVKRYRGVTYEVEIATSATDTKSNSQKLKKYRGKYY